MKDQLIEKEDFLDEIVQKRTLELERIAGMSAEEAKKMLMEQLKSDLAQEQLQLIRENEAKIRESALEKSKEILLSRHYPGRTAFRGGADILKFIRWARWCLLPADPHGYCRKPTRKLR